VRQETSSVAGLFLCGTIPLSGLCKSTCLGYLAEAPSFPAPCLLQGFARPRPFAPSRKRSGGVLFGEPPELRSVGVQVRESKALRAINPIVQGG